MKIQHRMAALLFATTLLAACSKEDQEGKTNEPNTSTNCKVSKVFLYKGPNNAPVIDTLMYTYTDDNITKLTAPEGYLTFEYSGGRITRSNYFDSLGATTSTEYQTATYNSDGTVAKIDWYSEGGAQLEDRYQFTYNAGKLVKLTYTMYWENAPSGYEDTHFYTYTGNNITRDSVVKSDPYGTGSSAVYYYTYDAQENQFSKGGTNALFNSPFALDFEGDDLPFLFSANNVTGFREDPNGEIADFSYITDGKGKLKMMKIFDLPVFAWEYECQ